MDDKVMAVSISEAARRLLIIRLLQQAPRYCGQRRRGISTFRRAVRLCRIPVPAKCPANRNFGGWRAAQPPLMASPAAQPLFRHSVVSPQHHRLGLAEATGQSEGG